MKSSTTKGRKWETAFTADQIEALHYGLAELAAVDQEVIESRLDSLVEQFDSVLSLAEHLFQMIPREVWRDQGGDDQQGHYEGDYYAEQIEQRLRSLRASLPASEAMPGKGPKAGKPRNTDSGMAVRVGPMASEESFPARNPDA